MKQHRYETVMKFLALAIPFYIIYYWELHEHPEKPFVKSLRNYTLAGFCIYILATILHVNFNYKL